MKKTGIKTIVIALGTAILCSLSMGTNIYASSMKVYNGHRYQSFDSTMKWNEAMQKCRQRGGHLVTITSSNEQKFVEKLINKQKRNIYWIGLYKSGYTNHWVTGERVSYLNIELNQWGQNYYGMYSRRSTPKGQKSNKGKWYDHDDILRNDFWDYTRTGYICEWDTTPISYATVLLKKNSNSIAEKITVTVKIGNTVLKQNRDYTVKYSSPKDNDANTTKIIISGKGSYTGKITKKYTIMDEQV